MLSANARYKIVEYETWILHTLFRSSIFAIRKLYCIYEPFQCTSPDNERDEHFPASIVSDLRLEICTLERWPNHDSSFREEHCIAMPETKMISIVRYLKMNGKRCNFLPEPTIKMHPSNHISLSFRLNHEPNLIFQRKKKKQLNCRDNWEVISSKRLPGNTDINSRHSSLETAVALAANGTE